MENIKNSIIEIVHISEKRKSLHKGYYFFVKMRDTKTNDIYPFYAYEEHTKSSRFIPFLNIGTKFKGLELFIKGEAKYINGNSDFTLLNK